MMNSKKAVASIMAALSLVTVPFAALNTSTPVVTPVTASAASNEPTMWIKDKNNNRLKIAISEYGFAKVVGGRLYGQILSVPDSVDYLGKQYKITHIADYAFQNDSNLIEVDLRSSSSLSYIGYNAFEGSGVETVYLGNAQELVQNDAFQNCTSLRKVDLSSSNLKWIYNGVFSGCTSLTDLKLPNNLIGIGACAFQNTNIPNIVIPQSVTAIQYRAFFGCNNLSRVEFEGSTSNQYELRLYSESFTNCPSLTSVVFNRSKFNADIDVFTTQNRVYDASKGRYVPEYTINPNVSMTGYGINGSSNAGINSYVDSVCKKLLRKWNISYNRNAPERDKMQTIKDLAQHIDEYMERNPINEDGNAATVLSLLNSACGGFARTFYRCALLMGMNENEVLIGGDGHCHAWNYIKNHGEWFVVDCGWDCFIGNNATEHVVTFDQYETFLKNTRTFQQSLADSMVYNPTDFHTIAEWIVCNYTTSGASDESQYNNVDIRDKVLTYLSRNNLGPIA